MRALEAAWVGGVLLLVALATGAQLVQLASALAVWLTFLYVQEASGAADDLETASGSSGVSRRLTGLLLLKESVWVFVFAVTGAYPALVGCGLFIGYPAWRRAWRK